MRFVSLSRGKVACVNDRDFKAVSQFKWSATLIGRNWYAVRRLPPLNGKQRRQSLHQFLMPGITRVDHRNGNGLDNQRHNLRPATRSQNNQNSRKRRGCSSRFKGVSWHKQAGKWAVRIRMNGKYPSLGLFDYEVEAGRMYDKYAKKLYKDFAKLNFPHDK